MKWIETIGELEWAKGIDEHVLPVFILVANMSEEAVTGAEAEVKSLLADAFPPGHPNIAAMLKDWQTGEPDYKRLALFHLRCIGAFGSPVDALSQPASYVLLKRHRLRGAAQELSLLASPKVLAVVNQRVAEGRIDEAKAIMREHSDAFSDASLAKLFEEDK